MATWDKADLLARCKREAGLPAVTEFPADTDWYAWLTEAQHEWMRELAAHAPEYNYCAPTLLVSSDSNYTYKFPSPWSGETGVYRSVYACEVYDRRDGALLRPTAYWGGADYVFEGDKIRMPRGQSRAFASGPYARYVAEPPDITAAIDPVLNPPAARILLVYRALIKWANRGGMRDPKAFQDMEDRAYYGVPERGIVGILASLKVGDTFSGAQAYADEDTPWYRGMDTGGYVP
jgi:hypothetical protein